MDRIDHLKALHLGQYLRDLIPRPLSLLEIYQELTEEQKRNIASHAPQITEHLQRIGQAIPEDDLLEIACLVPGVRRGNPKFQANLNAAQRKLSANDLDEASEWLRRVIRLISVLRSLTPEHRD